MTKIIQIQRLVVLFILIIIVSGCAYFNTFYNAKELFEESQKIYGEEKNKSKLSAKTVKKLNETVVKSQKVIVNFSDSKYVDDAMYYHGVCNFQLGKYEVSRKKLSELVLNYPNSEYTQRAQLWIAKCYFRQEKKNLAFSMLEKFVKNPKNKKYFGEAMGLAGQLAMEEGDDEKTFLYFNKAIENTKNNFDKNQLLYSLAVIYTDKNMLDDALNTLEKMSNTTKDLQMLMEVKIQYIKIYRLQKQYEKSKKLINQMLDNLDYEQMYAELEVELGLLYYDENDIDMAISKYKSVIKEYRNTLSESLASYYLAEIHLFDEINLLKASNYYKKVKNKEVKKEILTDVAIKNKLINNYIQLENKEKKLVKKEPKLLDNPFEYYELLKSSSNVTYSLIDSSRIDTLYDVKAQMDSLILLKLEKFIDDANNYVQVSFGRAEYLVFYFNQMDSALSIYQNILKEFPYVEMMPQVLNTYSFVLETEKRDSVMADSLYNLMINKFPESSVTYNYLGEENPDSVKYKEDQKKIFEIEKAFINDNKYLQAIEKLKNLAEIDSLDSINIAHTYYQIAWLYDYKLIETDSTIDEATKYYKIIIDEFPKTRFVKISKKRINEIQKIVENSLKAVNDTTEIVDEALKINDQKERKIEKEKIPMVEKETERKRPTFIRKRNLEE